MQYSINRLVCFDKELQGGWIYLPLWAPKSVAKKSNTWQINPTRGKKIQCLAKKILDLTIEQNLIEIDGHRLI